ncbi:hypothetical protein D3C75_678920 [compost metagenome]
MFKLNSYHPHFKDKNFDAILTAARLLEYKIGYWIVNRDDISITIKSSDQNSIITFHIYLENNDFTYIEAMIVSSVMVDNIVFEFKDRKKLYKEVLKWI